MSAPVGKWSCQVPYTSPNVELQGAQCQPMQGRARLMVPGVAARPAAGPHKADTGSRAAHVLCGRARTRRGRARPPQCYASAPCGSAAPRGAPPAAPPCAVRGATVMNRPFCVWMVAPVVMPTSWSGTSAKSKRRSTTASATTASISANWSPTHLRGPPLKGINLRGGHGIV